MKLKIKKYFLIILFITVLPILSACGAGGISSDELILKIDLDLSEEIGLFIIDWDLDGKSGSGGVSNADKSMISPDETLDFSFDKSQFQNIEEPFDLTLNFTVTKEYFEPNYDNIYPEEALVHLEPLSFEAAFGNNYDIVITGGKDEGYKARLQS